MAKQIQTSILISASPEKVWRILTDFERYPKWNPFIKEIHGAQKVGSQLTVQLTDMKFTPTLLSFEKEKHFSWKGKLFLPYLFDGEHSFQLVQKSEQLIEFRHEETFSGILPFFLGKKFFQSIEEGFIQMNEALKKEC